MHSHGMRQVRPSSVTQIFKGQPGWIVMTAFSHRGCTRTASRAQRLILPSPRRPFVRPAKQLVTETPQVQEHVQRTGSSCCDTSEVEGQVEAPTSDTDSMEPHRNRRRRLRLNWNPQGSDDRFGPVHQPRQHQVRAAEVLFHELARRVGAVPVGSPVPRVVLQQRWSPINVPLMWAAAGSEPSIPLLDWLCEITAGVPDIQLNEGTLPTNVAVRTGWQALRESDEILGRWAGS